jgi:hypothetical protein
VLGRLRGRACWLLAVTSLVGCGGDSGGDENGSGTGGSSGIETGGRGGTTSGGAGTGGANNDAGESGTAAGGRNAAGGSTTGGRSSSGGTPSGGRSQTGGAGPTGGEGEAAGTSSGGASGAEHCSPGKTYENFRAYEDAGGPISNCYGYDPTGVGQPADAEISVRSIALADPLAAGSEMAFSIEWIAGGASIEYWGTNESCGAGVERLSSATSLAPNITCSTWEGTAEFNHVLMVWVQGGGQHGDVTLCAAGSCSP